VLSWLACTIILIFIRATQQADDKLKRSLEKLESKIREKDQTIAELNGMLRNTNLKVP